MRFPRRRSTAAGAVAVLAAAAAVVVATLPASSANAATASWPTATGNKTVSATIQVSGTYDGHLTRYNATSALGDGGQSEHQKPLFQLANGATLQNVIIGSDGADGIHCMGSCTLKNVWWEDVGEDAATFEGTSASQTMTIDGGGARNASDKVFQHNGPGTMIIENFQVQNFGKLYRSCGNCKTTYTRHVVVSNVTATAPGKAIVGINTNFGDTAVLHNITIVGDSKHKIDICTHYKGTKAGSEPTKTGSGPDGTHCQYSASDITYR